MKSDFYRKNFILFNISITTIHMDAASGRIRAINILNIPISVYQRTHIPTRYCYRETWQRSLFLSAKFTQIISHRAYSYHHLKRQVSAVKNSCTMYAFFYQVPRCKRNNSYALIFFFELSLWQKLNYYNQPDVGTKDRRERWLHTFMFQTIFSWLIIVNLNIMYPI